MRLVAAAPSLPGACATEASAGAISAELPLSIAAGALLSFEYNVGLAALHPTNIIAAVTQVAPSKYPTRCIVLFFISLLNLFVTLLSFMSIL